MTRLRKRRRDLGETQVTAFLDADASELLRQMTKHRGAPYGELLSDAVCKLAFDYDYWNCSRLGRDEWWYESEIEDESPAARCADEAVPPWIITEERRAAGMRKEWEKADNDGLDVYRKGYEPPQRRDR